MLARQIGCLCPASCSRNTAMICSSVNLTRFIVRPSLGPNSKSTWRKNLVAGHDLQVGLPGHWVKWPSGTVRMRMIFTVLGPRVERTANSLFMQADNRARSY